jgi:hypothetical protein
LAIRLLTLDMTLANQTGNGRAFPIRRVEKTLKLSAFRLFAFLIVGGCLFADDLQWGGTYLAAWSGFGTSPYTAIDASNNNKALTIFCLDFNDEIAPPIDWTANIRPLTPGNVTAFAQFGGNYGQGITAPPFVFKGDSLAAGNPHSVDLTASSAAYTRYLEATWLFANIGQSLTHGDVNTSVISQVGAWDLFVEDKNQSALAKDIKAYNGASSYTFNNYLYSANSYSTPPTTQSFSGLQFEEAVDEALNAAQNAVLHENWVGSSYIGSWNLVTGDPVWTAKYGKPVQEFLTDAPPVPEPGAVVLLGTVMAAIGLARRRRRA